MSILLDTNILLRLTQKSSPQHLIARQKIIDLRQNSEELCIVPQNVVEFWAVATRPAQSNGLGLSIKETQREVRKFKRLFEFLNDKSDVFSHWESLVTRYQISGKTSHDARLVAAMLSQRINSILTFNVGDFNRFVEITVMDCG